MAGIPVWICTLLTIIATVGFPIYRYKQGKKLNIHKKSRPFITAVLTVVIFLICVFLSEVIITVSWSAMQ